MPFHNIDYVELYYICSAILQITILTHNIMKKRIYSKPCILTGFFAAYHLSVMMHNKLTGDLKLANRLLNEFLYEKYLYETLPW